MSPNAPAGYVEVLKRWFDAFNARDIDALCQMVDPCVEVIPLVGETAGPGMHYHGPDGLRTMLEASFERFPRMRLTHTEPHRVGGYVVVNLVFMLDDSVEPPLVRKAACEYRIRGDLITRLRALDPEDALRRWERERCVLLSPREREVLTWIAAGNTIQEIADDLQLSPLTVRTHVRNAKDKLRARTTPQAVAIAVGENALDR